MPVQARGGKTRDEHLPGNRGADQQQSQVESAAAGPSSSTASARHNGHTKAREHDATSQPQRQAEQYSTGGL